VPAPGGGPQGGAILCPAPLHCSRGRALIPGCAVAAAVTDPYEEAHTSVSFYLPPGPQQEIATRLALLPRLGGRLVVGGDLNLDLAQVRQPQELEAHEALHHLKLSWDLQAIH